MATDAAAAKQWRAPAFNFYDARLLGGAWRGEERPDIAREFFRVLSVCHTVIPDGVPSTPHTCRACQLAACAPSPITIPVRKYSLPEILNSAAVHYKTTSESVYNQ